MAELINVVPVWSAGVMTAVCAHDAGCSAQAAEGSLSMTAGMARQYLADADLHGIEVRSCAACSGAGR